MVSADNLYERSTPSKFKFYLLEAITFLVILLIGLDVLPGTRETLKATDTEDLDFNPEEQAEYVKENQTFLFKRTFRYPAGDTLVQFLFKELEVNAAMVRGWGLLNLHVEKTNKQTYHVRVGNKMDGPTYRLSVEPRTVRYVGKGVYRQNYLPFAIEGSALMELDWIPTQDTEAVLMTATLRLRPTSEMLHLLGTLMYPLAHSALEDALDRVIRLGRTLAITIRNHPIATTERLRSIDESYARRWQQYINSSRSFETTRPYGPSVVESRSILSTVFLDQIDRSRTVSDTRP
jgi:hypothetical protein